MEIEEAIKNLKQQKKANQPTDHQCLILLEIRGKLLYVNNSSAAVTFGLTKELDMTLTLSLWSGSVHSCRMTLMKTFRTNLKRSLLLCLQSIRSKCRRSWRN